MSQRATVARLLEERGEQGVHTFELRRMFIGNPSERIAELEREGWAISSTREKLNGEAYGTRYRVEATVSTPESAPRASGSGHVAGGGLGSDRLFTPSSRPHYDEAA